MAQPSNTETQSNFEGDNEPIQTDNITYDISETETDNKLDDTAPPITESSSDDIDIDADPGSLFIQSVTCEPEGDNHILTVKVSFNFNANDTNGQNNHKAIDLKIEHFHEGSFLTLDETVLTGNRRRVVTESSVDTEAYRTFKFTAIGPVQIDRIRALAFPRTTSSGHWSVAQGLGLTYIHESPILCPMEEAGETDSYGDLTSSQSQTQEVTEPRPSATDPVYPEPTLSEGDTLPPVQTTTTSTDYYPEQPISATESENIDVPTDGSFLDINCGDLDAVGAGMCCTSPTQTNNAVVFEVPSTTWKSAKRYFPQAMSEDLTSCDLKPPVESGDSCTSYHIKERMSMYYHNHIPGWFFPTGVDSLSDIRAINGPDENGYPASPKEFPVKYDNVDYNADVFNDLEKFIEGHVEPNKTGGEVITFTCDVTGERTNTPPGAVGWHKRDATDGLTYFGDGLAKKEPISDGLDLSTDPTKKYFAPKYNSEWSNYEYTGSLTDNKKGVRVIEGAWDKSTAYYTTAAGGTYLAPMTYKPIFDREFYQVKMNIVENWKTSDGHIWNVDRLAAFGFEYIKPHPESGNLIGNYSNKTPYFGGGRHGNAFRQSGSTYMYVSDDGKIALMYSVTAGWQFVDTLDGYPITVLLPEEYDLPQASGMSWQGPRSGEHENGRLNISYHTGNIIDAGDGVELELSANEEEPWMANLNVQLTNSESSSTSTGKYNKNELIFEFVQNSLFQVTNNTSGDSVIWNLSGDFPEIGRHKELLFRAESGNNYIVNIVFSAIEVSEDTSGDASIQSTGSNGAHVGMSRTTSATSLREDPHVSTFFGEDYNM
tara:strand:+ start:27284 stop:29758 length:2475 start_codon:yes stop_codon:yes gene_type:complete